MTEDQPPLELIELIMGLVYEGNNGLIPLHQAAFALSCCLASILEDLPPIFQTAAIEMISDLRSDRSVN